MEIKTDEYSVIYNSDTATVICKGSFLLSSAEEYAPILQFLNTAVEQQPKQLTLDVKDLEFLNSSGINMFTKFVIGIRKNTGMQLIALGYNEIPWQVRLLKNLQRLLPTLQLKLE